MTELSVGINWDPHLISRLASLKNVKEVFGSSNKSTFGSGRNSIITANATDEEITDYITEVHRCGLKFNYTMNAPCLDNKEYDPENHLKIIKHIEWLVKTGVDSVTVTIPYLLEIVKKQFPTLYTKVSLIAAVNSVHKAKYWEEMGADEIVVDFMINRDFSMLKKFKRSITCNLSLSANEGCLKGCAYRNYHYTTAGHSSQKDHFLNGFVIEYPSLKCSLERVKDPAHYIRSPWIRPEDMAFYEEIGYDKFKVCGRNFSSDWIFNAAEAYDNRRYNGNLNDILNIAMPGQSTIQRTVNFEIIAEKIPHFKSPTLMKLGEIHPKPPVINNQMLKGFINQFVENKCEDNCNFCSYCKSIAEKAMVINQNDEQTINQCYTSIIDDMTSSRLFITDEDRLSPREVDLTGAEKAADSEYEIEIIWPETIRKNFDEAISHIPKLFAVLARKSIQNAIISNAKSRGSREINEADFVKAMLDKTPHHVRGKMIRGLKEMGIDSDKYL